MLRAMQCLCIGGLNQTLHLVAIVPLVSMKLCSTCFRATSICACSCVCVCVWGGGRLKKEFMQMISC